MSKALWIDNFLLFVAVYMALLIVGHRKSCTRIKSQPNTFQLPATQQIQSVVGIIYFGQFRMIKDLKSVVVRWSVHRRRSFIYRKGLFKSN